MEYQEHFYFTLKYIMKIMEGSMVYINSKFPSSSVVRIRIICLEICKNMRTEDVSKRGKCRDQ